MKTPKKLVEETACFGISEVDISTTVMDIIDDVVDSVELSLKYEGAPKMMIDSVMETVKDYVTSHYGNL